VRSDSVACKVDVDKQVKSLDKQVKSLDKQEKSLDKSQKSLDKSQKCLDKLLIHTKKPHSNSKCDSLF